MTGLTAQTALDVHQFDATIARFLEAGRQDSFLYYSHKKCLLARQADSLELWAWERFDAYEAFETSPAQGLQLLEETLQQRWREPRTPAEWQPFLYIEASRGWHLFEMGRIWQAVQAYEAAARCYEPYRYPDFDAVEVVYKPLGVHYTRLGDDDKALATFHKALALGGDDESMAGLYCNIGLAFWNKGDYQAAETNFRTGLTLTTVSAAKRALLLGALAQSQLDQGRIRDAAATAASSLQLLNGPIDNGPMLEYRCYSRRTAGIANLKLGRFAAAERLLSGALEDAEAMFGTHSRDVGKIEVARSRLFLLMEKPEMALAASDRALVAVLPDFKPSSSHKAQPIADFFYEENTIFEALIAKAEAAKALFEYAGETSWLVCALECHDLAWQAEARLRRVYQYSSSKLHLQKDARLREEAAMEIVRALYEQTGEIAWLEKSITLAERSKAVLLFEAMQDNLLRQRKTLNDPRFAQINALRQGLSYFDKNLLLEPANEKAVQWRMEGDALRGQIAALEQSLRKAYPEFAGLEFQAAQWLPAYTDFTDGEMLVEYFISARWVDIWVFSPKNTPLWTRIPADSAWQNLVLRYLAFFENDFAILNNPSDFFQTAYALWQKLLPPATASAGVLTIVPDGILNFVPFEALLTRTDAHTTLRNADYLVRNQEVRYAWSLAVLRQQRNLRSGASKSLLAIAPGFAQHERGLAPLAAPDFSGKNAALLRGADATLAQFLQQAPQYRILHFSTHAFAGEQPRIELMDQSLLLPDLYALPLQADLVVLSACQTGLGKEEKGEGVMSLARAFASAGAACVVSSLWSVNDQSTARLMEYFYQRLDGGATSGAALRQAKLAYLADPSVETAALTPYFWAGLVHVGADRRLGEGSRLSVWVLVSALGLALLGGWLRRYWRRRQ
ncbi:MAG: CHAT domain-containing tetratricopeptide repeat protein [Saprospiraceae bacterium]|nr:CHAT domain-containing tetratricopeptide repeat protein [Saprospiraceae bacterium]